MNTDGKTGKVLRMGESNLVLRFNGSVPFDWDNMPASFSSCAMLHAPATGPGAFYRVRVGASKAALSAQ